MSHIRVARRIMSILAIAVVVIGVGSWRAEGEPGADRLIRGRIIVWPQGESRLAGLGVVQTDDGRRYFVQFTEQTAVPKGLTEGQLVTIVGHEGFEPDQITASTIEQRPAEPSTTTALPKGRQELSGQVAGISGSTVALKTPDGRTVAVDVSLVQAERRRVLTRGSQITVIGVHVAPGLLTARDVLSSSKAPAASSQR